MGELTFLDLRMTRFNHLICKGIPIVNVFRYDVCISKVIFMYEIKMRK